MKGYILTGNISPALHLTELPAPEPGEEQVRVDIKAVSLNYRDLLVAEQTQGDIPLSDGAGVISAVGSKVTGLKVGDRVVIGFMPGWAEGEFSAEKQASSLGGPGVNGVLTEQVRVPASGVTLIPDSMSFEQAATLPCAGVTAWSALFERRPLQPRETVLLLGTGGFLCSHFSWQNWRERASLSPLLPMRNYNGRKLWGRITPSIIKRTLHGLMRFCH